MDFHLKKNYSLSFCLSHLFRYVPIMVSSWNFQEWLLITEVMSVQKFKVRGKKLKLQRSKPKLAISGPWLQLDFTYGDEMMHKAWYCLGAVPYWFSRPSVKFQGHTAKKIIDFDQNCAFPDSISSLNSQMAMKWCIKFEVAYKRCPIVFQGHPWNFKVTRDKYRWFWAELSVSGLSLQFEYTDGFDMIYKAWSSRTGALSFVKVIHQISRSQRTESRQFWPKLSVSGL